MAGLLWGNNYKNIMDSSTPMVTEGNPQDWQQAQSMMIQLFKGWQAQMEELVRVFSKEAKAQVTILNRQQELSEKIKVQQAMIMWAAEGLWMPKMIVEGDTETYLEAFKTAMLAAEWNPEQLASQLGPLLIGCAQAAYRALSRDEAGNYN